jgi:hypothetical protein
VAVTLPPQHRQLHLDLLYLDQRHLQPGFRGGEFRQPGITLRQLAPQRRNFFLKRLDVRHVLSLPGSAPMYKDSLDLFVKVHDQTTTSGRTVQAVLRQSIDSRSIENCAIVRDTTPSFA